jgi:hypothetical protein
VIFWLVSKVAEERIFSIFRVGDYKALQKNSIHICNVVETSNLVQAANLFRGNKTVFVRFQILMSAIVKMAVVWDVAPCRLLMMGAAGVV